MELRPPRFAGWLLRRRRRVPVPVAAPAEIQKWLDEDGGDGGDEGGDGSAGVREPRNPKPFGPMSGAGEAVPEDPPLTARLPDPRR